MISFAKRRFCIILKRKIKCYVYYEYDVMRHDAFMLILLTQRDDAQRTGEQFKYLDISKNSL